MSRDIRNWVSAVSRDIRKGSSRKTGVFPRETGVFLA